MVEVVDPDLETSAWAPPRIPASAGALIRDRRERLLILNPAYKKHWTIPGGRVEENGETPWEACRRETLEECGLEVTSARLVCVDFLRPSGARDGGIRYLFDCGALDEEQLGAIALQREEISEYRLVELAQAQALLSGPLRRRVTAAAAAEHCVYLEDGRPLRAVRS
jgi:8-oxo-dGTP pyrophosphatase MutT (NUDIX family)